MARASVPLESAPEVDQLDGFALPREQTRLVGHASAQAALLDAYRSRRIHHAWILGGPKGSGKATLAFRFARFVLANPDPGSPGVAAAHDLAVDAAHPTARRIAVGAHADLLHLRRPWDDKAKRFKTELPVDEIRRTVGFFGSTAGEGGWRIAIVDPADDMNGNAANALLKILEEPPARSLFLIVAHQPGRLLPTIRSRCRTLSLDPLDPDDISRALADFGVAAQHPPGAVAAAAALSEGSIRRAALMLELNGVALYEQIRALTRELPRLDLRAGHALADQLTQRGQEDLWELGLEFLIRVTTERAHDAVGRNLAGAARWAELSAEIEARAATADALNLDRKALVLSILRALVDTARNSL
ncbi:MAG: DNA polymerase III subunit delta' [Ancalomicrobiaceae bacterium]|nr:DNA polymerase III subunit delta' [Ancalomicrobiaceae bacterium]